MKNPILFITICLMATNLFAQKWVSPNYDNHRLDYRDLGYPEVNEIPADNARISALLTGHNGYIYGATSGKVSYMFLYDRQINKVRPLGKLPATSGIHHAMVQDKNGYIYLGTGLNLLDEIPLTRDFPGGHRAIEHQLWIDIKAYHDKFPGGRILRYNPAHGDEGVYLEESPAIVDDLGLVLAKNSIYALTIDNQKDILYGITYPDAHFFSFDINTRRSQDYGPMLDTLVFSGPERSWRSVPRALLVLEDGRVLTSGIEGYLTIFDPTTGKFDYTRHRIPGEYWESWNYIGYPVIEQLIQGDDNQVWGSTSDGFIFRLDLETMKLYNLGKPRITRRIRGMALGLDDNLYILAGEMNEPVKLFTYNTKTREGFLNYSYLSVDRSPYYQKRGYQFEAITVGKDNSIFMGESDRRGKLFIFTPGGIIFDGGLNPKNPR
jgi:hypothetical protein